MTTRNHLADITRNDIARAIADLHLPDITRNDIARAIADLHLPDIDLPEAVSRIDWPRIELPSVDLGKAVAGAAQATHLAPRPRRPRWLLPIVGLAVAGLAGLAILRDLPLRARLARAVHAVQAWGRRMRAHPFDGLSTDHVEPIANDAARGAAINAAAADPGLTKGRIGPAVAGAGAPA